MKTDTDPPLASTTVFKSYREKHCIQEWAADKAADGIKCRHSIYK